MPLRELTDIELHADLARVIEHWRALYATKGQAPLIRDIDLMDFYDIAGRMIIADRVGEPPKEKYYWRFAGATFREIWGMELTGKFLHETHDAETTRAATEVYRTMAANSLPHYWVRPAGVIHEDRSHIHYERVVLPLANATGDLSHFLGVYVFFRRPDDRADYDATEYVVRIKLPEKSEE
ncbi:MAG: PAS domain-containing protein [Rhodospirillales bacterium]|nr:PAS domain-containing protein [Rhodospirillales bacterium]